MSAATMSEDDSRKRREQALLDTLTRLGEASKKMGEQIKESATVAGATLDRSFFKRWQNHRAEDDKIADEAYVQRARTNLTLGKQEAALNRQERISRSMANELHKLRLGLFQRMDDELEYRKLMDRRNGIRKQVSSWERLANGRNNQPTSGNNQGGSSGFDLPFGLFGGPDKKPPSHGKPGTGGGWLGGKNKKPAYRPAKPNARPPLTRPGIKPELNGGIIGKGKDLGKKIAQTRAGKAVTNLSQRVAGSAAGQGVKTIVQGGVKKVAGTAAGASLKAAALQTGRVGAEMLGKIPIAGILVTGGLTAYDQSQKTEAEIAAEGGKTTSVLKDLAGNASFGLSDYLMRKAEESKSYQAMLNSDIGRKFEDGIGRAVSVALSPFSQEARDALKADWKANVTPLVDKSLKAIETTTKSWRDGMTSYTRLATEQLGVWKDIAGNGIRKMIDVLVNLPTILAGAAIGGVKKAAENLLPSNWDVGKYVPKGVKDAAKNVSTRAGYLENRDALVAGAKRTGADVGFLTRIATAESNFDEKVDAGQNGKYKTTAGGLYQFTDRTWSGMLKMYGKELGLSPNASKYDPKAASLLAGKLAGDNKRALDSNLGRSANSYDQYMAWFLGRGHGGVRTKGGAKDANGNFKDIGKRVGAIGFLQAMAQNPNAIGADVMESASIDSNESIYYEMGKGPNGKQVRKRARTLAEIYQLMSKKMEAGATLAADAEVYAANNYGYKGVEHNKGQIKGAPVDTPAVAKAPDVAPKPVAKTPAKPVKVAKVDKKKKPAAVQGDKSASASNKAADSKAKEDAAMAASAAALAAAMPKADTDTATPEGAKTPVAVTKVQATPEQVAVPVVAVAPAAMPVVPTAVSSVAAAPVPVSVRDTSTDTGEQLIATQIVQQQIVKSSNQEAPKTADVQPVAAPAQAQAAEAAPISVTAQTTAALPEAQASIPTPEVTAAPTPVTPSVAVTAVPERPVSDSLPPEMRTVVVDNQPDLSKIPPPQVVVQKEERSGGVGPMPTLNDIPTTIGEMGLSLVNLAQT